MKTLEILTKEHALIVQAIENLVVARDRLERGERPPKEFFLKAVEFFKTFADKFHHFKEEFLMFGLLSQKDEGACDTEIGTLRFQHERCRTCIGNIEASIDGYSAGDEIAVTVLLENLASYVSLLKLHIYMEDHVFFEMVEKKISKKEDLALLSQFEIEEERIGKTDFLAKSRDLVHRMAMLIKSE